MHADKQRNRYSIFLASSISSVISTLVSNPIQVAKTNIQYYPLSCQYYPHSSISLAKKGFRQLITCTCSNFSMQGSIRSLKVVLPQVTISNIFYMQLYQKGIHEFKDKLNYGVTSSTLMSVFIARTIVSTFMLPLQVLRVRMSNDIQSEIKSKESLFKYSGFKVTLVRDLTYSLLFWMTLENVRDYFIGTDYRQKLKKSHHSTKEIIQLNLLPALLSGSIISAITTPVDTIKTRLQSQAATNPSIFRELIKIYKKQGMMGLFSGVHFRVLKNSIHSSLYVSLFEFSMNKLKKKTKQ